MKWNPRDKSLPTLLEMEQPAALNRFNPDFAEPTLRRPP
jgi:hypothetical protein